MRPEPARLDGRRIRRALACAGLGRLSSLTRLGGYDSRVYTAETVDGQRAVVKITRSGNARHHVAAWAARQMAAAGVPAPQVLWHDHLVRVETHCPGQPLAHCPPHAAASLRAASRAGRLLRRLHHIEVGGFGRLDHNGAGQHCCLRDWLLHPPPPPGAKAGGFDTTELAAAVRQALLRHSDTLPDTAARLLHGDLNARHVLTSHGTVTGLVDLDSVRGGDPLADLAGWSLNEPAALADALFDGYFPQPPNPAACTRLVLYRLRIAVALMHRHARLGQQAAVRLRAAQLDGDLRDLAEGHTRLQPQPTGPPVAPHLRRTRC